MADRIIKGDSGNDVVIQNNDGTRKIEVTNSGDVEITGDVKTTTVKATNLKANDGTAGLVIADSTGEVTSSGGLKAVNLKASNLKANDGTAGLSIADSTGRLSVTETNPVITLGSNTTFGSGVSLSNATFPNKNFFIAAYVVFDGTSDTGSGATQTILDSLNVTSVTRKAAAVGEFTVTLSSAMANSNYVIIGSANATGSGGAIAQYDSSISAINTTSFGIRVRDAGNTVNKNVSYTNVIVIGDR